MLFLQEKDKNIFIKIPKKKYERLDFQNWVFNHLFNQITLKFIKSIFLS